MSPEFREKSTWNRAVEAVSRVIGEQVREEGGTRVRERVSTAAGDSAGLHGMEFLGPCPVTW